MDTVSKDQRSLNMSHIRAKNTSIEMKVRKHLFSLGFRYRINVKSLPGKPDIVLNKCRTAIFVNGCFCHHHENCRYASTPKSNIEYWTKKFSRNVENDAKNKEVLEQKGWSVAVLWECELKKDFDQVMNKLIEVLYGNANL